MNCKKFRKWMKWSKLIPIQFWRIPISNFDRINMKWRKDNTRKEEKRKGKKRNLVETLDKILISKDVKAKAYPFKIRKKRKNRR